MPSAVSEPRWEQKYGIQKEIHNRNTTESPRARRTSLFSPTPPPPPLGGRRFTKETALAINMGWNERDLQNRCSGGGAGRRKLEREQNKPSVHSGQVSVPRYKTPGVWANLGHFGPIAALRGEPALPSSSRRPPLHHLPWPQHSGHCPPQPIQAPNEPRTELPQTSIFLLHTVHPSPLNFRKKRRFCAFSALSGLLKSPRFSAVSPSCPLVWVRFMKLMLKPQTDA